MTMSATWEHTTVVTMVYALILSAASPAPAKKGTDGMVKGVKVSLNPFQPYSYVQYHVPSHSVPPLRNLHQDIKQNDY